MPELLTLEWFEDNFDSRRAAQRMCAKLGVQYREGRPQFTAENGHPYFTVASSGIKDEGSPYGVWYTTWQEALAALERALDEHIVRNIVNSEPNTIYVMEWRTLPRIVSEVWARPVADSKVGGAAVHPVQMFTAACRVAVYPDNSKWGE